MRIFETFFPATALTPASRAVLWFQNWGSTCPCFVGSPILFPPQGGPFFPNARMRPADRSPMRRWAEGSARGAPWSAQLWCKERLVQDEDQRPGGKRQIDQASVRYSCNPLTRDCSPPISEGPRSPGSHSQFQLRREGRLRLPRGAVTQRLWGTCVKRAGCTPHLEPLDSSREPPPLKHLHFERSLLLQCCKLGKALIGSYLLLHPFPTKLF